MMKQDGRDLLAEFRALAPPHPPIRIQRWSVRRVVLTLWVLLLGAHRLRAWSSRTGRRSREPPGAPARR